MFDIGSKYANEVIERVEAGEESEVQGLLEQWLRDGKLTKEEYVSQSVDMFGAGVDTVSHNAGEIISFHMYNIVLVMCICTRFTYRLQTKECSWCLKWLEGLKYKRSSMLRSNQCLVTRDIPRLSIWQQCRT